jgi:hypothetical protein
MAICFPIFVGGMTAIDIAATGTFRPYARKRQLCVFVANSYPNAVFVNRPIIEKNSFVSDFGRVFRGAFNEHPDHFLSLI